MDIVQKTISPLDTLFTRNVPHILEKIFFSLDYESYKKCLEVSNTLKELLLTESFKKKAALVYKLEISDDEIELRMQSYHGNIDAVKKLISSDLVDVNNADEIGRTPLHHAATGGHKEVIKVLLDGGADPNTPLSQYLREVALKLKWASRITETTQV